MHWADVLAEELLKDNKKHVLATGITPSGPIHIGNMREVLTTDAVYRSLKEKGAKADFIYIADDFDNLRKVYPFLPESYEKYVGMPISEIPCPCGEHKSYADHFLMSFLDSLKELGIYPIVHRASEMYKSGMYEEAIKTALDNTERIKTIIETVSKRQLPKQWIPFNILCTSCGRITTAKPVLYEFPFVEYTCECGYEGKVDIQEGGVGKLPWRVDWPARWKILGVTYEPFGKDHGAAGGTHDTGAVIAKDIFKYPPPKYTTYEFILLKGKGAMHSSKGTALSAGEMLCMTPPEVLRFLLMNNQPNKHIVFDPGLGLLSLVDEYDQLERVYFNAEKKTKGMKDLEKTYELSQPYEVPKHLPHQVPYRHLVTVVQIGKTWKDIKKILQRTEQIPNDMSTTDEARLKQRAEHVTYWLEYFAPEMLKFEIKQKLPKVDLSSEQHRFVTSFLDILSSLEWDGEHIHNAIYEIAETENIPIKTAFTTTYQLLLGQEKGPRAGYFLSNVDKSFVLKRFKEAVK
ncbi:MAG: lysine--tRNA ligase [Candidatus Thermoplasmatota archaeon]|nr:lysine--tRNA ligase [Candidatus Thermoplasmatota archaeon]